MKSHKLMGITWAYTGTSYRVYIVLMLYFMYATGAFPMLAVLEALRRFLLVEAANLRGL